MRHSGSAEQPSVHRGSRENAERIRSKIPAHNDALCRDFCFDLNTSLKSRFPDFKMPDSSTPNGSGKFNNAPTGFNFSRVPTGPKHPAPQKTWYYLPRINEAALDGPYIFVAACHVPPRAATVPHLKRMIRSCWPKDVLVDEYGYYIVFENTKIGRDNACHCHSQFNDQLLFQEYLLVMEYRDARERHGSTFYRSPSSAHADERSSTDLQEKQEAKLGADRSEPLQQKLEALSWPLEERIQQDIARDASSSNRPDSDTASNDIDGAEIQHYSEHAGHTVIHCYSHTLPGTGETTIGSPLEGRTTIFDEKDNDSFVIEKGQECEDSKAAVSMNDENAGSHSQNVHECITKLTDGPTRSSRRPNESTRDPHTLRVPNARFSARSTSSDDSASTLSSITSSRSSSVLSDMSVPRCHKCTSVHSPDHNKLIKCASCRRQFHGRCHKPPIPAEPKLRQFWQCNHCLKRDRPQRPHSERDAHVRTDIEKARTRSEDVSRTQVKEDGCQTRPSGPSDHQANVYCPSVPKNLEARDTSPEGFLVYESDDATRKLPRQKRSISRDPPELAKQSSPIEATEPHDCHATDPEHNTSVTNKDISTRSLLSNTNVNSPRTVTEYGLATISGEDTAPVSTNSQPGEVVSEKSRPEISVDFEVSNSSQDCNPVATAYSHQSQGLTYDENTRPIYTYKCLVGMALCDSPGYTMTAAQVITWITQRFPYYRSLGGSWKGSISAILSAKLAFEKQPKSAFETGKASCWTLVESERARYSQSLEEARQKLHLISTNTPSNGSDFGIEPPIEELNENPAEQFEIKNNGYRHYEIVCKSPSNKPWQDLASLESVQFSNLTCHVGDLVEYPCVPWHCKENPGKAEQISTGQVLGIRMSQDGHPLFHVLWYYERKELKNILCKNFKKWPSQCRWMKSTHMDVIPAQQVTGLLDHSIMRQNSQGLVLDFSVGTDKGSKVRPEDHMATSWLKNELPSSQPVERSHHANAPRLAARKHPSSHISAAVSISDEPMTDSANSEDDTDGLPLSATNVDAIEKGHRFEDSRSKQVKEAAASEATFYDEYVQGKELVTSTQADEEASSMKSLHLLAPCNGATSGDDTCVEDAHIEDCRPKLVSLTNASKPGAIFPHNEPTAAQDYSNVSKEAVEEAFSANDVLREPLRNAATSVIIEPEPSIPAPECTVAELELALKNELNNRRFVNAGEYDLLLGKDLDSRLLQPVPKASRRYFKKRKPGRECADRLFPIDNGKSSDNKSKPVSEKNIEASQASNSSALCNSSNVEMASKEVPGTQHHGSFQEFFGVRNEGDYEMILHEGKLAFREKASVRNPIQVFNANELIHFQGASNRTLRPKIYSVFPKQGWS